MDFNEEKVEEQQDDFVDIYSKKAIFGFSIFSFLFAGVLLIINLWAAGYKKVVSQVLLFLVFFYLIYINAIRYSGIKIDQELIKKASTGASLTFTQLLPMLELMGLILALNIIAGLVLTKYFFKKYFPDDDYYPKPIWRPLVIYIMLSLLSRFLM
ncbi:hypothetical protein [Mucilaginibacter sp. FT3.2]|uniref:hypothetical protein n=1 Tax=Mucilaginibacter sp. FT3.2 TaxID=2723090 RepID=UPI001622C2E6|nr:hypothetical protein [Mucilaginibacter sp. FT3.2]MBB6234692.1 glucan phosphoethanolaminetransferase (alkaline phosphatase superfamily) [Mucilaginibacter sp. FT3.2]